MRWHTLPLLVSLHLHALLVVLHHLAVHLLTAMVHAAAVRSLRRSATVLHCRLTVGRLPLGAMPLHALHLVRALSMVIHHLVVHLLSAVPHAAAMLRSIAAAGLGCSRRFRGRRHGRIVGKGRHRGRGKNAESGK